MEDLDNVLAHFLPQFCETAQERIKNGLAHVASGAQANAPQIVAEFHTLAGEAAMLGLAEIATAARSGEKAAKRLAEGPVIAAECARTFRNLKRAVDEIVAGQVTAKPAPRGAAMHARILVVDDSPLTAGLLRDALEDHGFEARATSDEKFNMEDVRRFAPHLILADVQMSHLDTATLCANVRAAELEHPPAIVLVSGLSDAELDERATRAGADGYVSKSQGLGPVIDRVKHYLPKEAP